VLDLDVAARSAECDASFRACLNRVEQLIQHAPGNRQHREGCVYALRATLRCGESSDCRSGEIGFWCAMGVEQVVASSSKAQP